MDDGRHFINKASRPYDVIVFDVFQGEVPPWQMLTLECFTKTYDLLNDDGVLLIEFFGNTEGEANVLASINKTLASAGFKTRVIDVKTNENVIAAFKKEPSIDYLEVSNPLLGTRDSMRLSDLKFQDQPATFSKKAELLTDNSPKLEKMVLESSLEWRRYQNSLFRDQLTKYDYPLFY